MTAPSLLHEPHINYSNAPKVDHVSIEVSPIAKRQSTGMDQSTRIPTSPTASQRQERMLGHNPRGSGEIHTGGGEESSVLLSFEHHRGSLSDAESELCRLPASSNTEKAGTTSTVLLRRSNYIVFMVLAYSSLALTAWILTCLLTHNPLTASQYGFNVNDDSYGSTARTYHAKYVKSEEVYRAARTLQAIVAVLTIPLTSAVCSAAAVVFSQAGPKVHRLTMRQMMVLADKGWSDPTTILKLVFGDRRRYVSRLLVIAILINILGALITPLQTILVTPKLIKTPTTSTTVLFLTDIADQFDASWDDDLVTVMTRNSLSASNTAPQARLWQNDFNCSRLDSKLIEQCLFGAATLGQISKLSNPYFAQLPAGFNTVVIKQFLPRMNSTVRWESVPVETMPVTCGALPDAFYVHYSNSTWPPESEWNLIGGAPKNWSIEACMPGNQSASPWKSTYERQDFMEELYLNISVMGYDWQGGSRDTLLSGGIFRVTSNTTAGYFELPNHMNGGKAGQLLDGDPESLCGSDCMPQRTDKLSSRSAPINYQSDGSWRLNQVKNKGPLLTVAMALFGYGSYIQTRPDLPEAYLTNSTNGTYHGISCVDQRPFDSLLEPRFKSNSDCIMDNVQTAEELDIEIAKYLYSFYENTAFSIDDVEGPTNAFAAAVFLATEAWFTARQDIWGSREVYFDPGADTTIPAMSRAGMIVLSLLLGIYLACIIALSVYSSRKPRWTQQLDSFSMMRIGAKMHEKLPFKVGFEAEAIRVLDEMPGFVGDATGGEGDFGVLGIGSNTILNGVRRYECFEADAVRQAREVALDAMARGRVDTNVS